MTAAIVVAAIVGVLLFIVVVLAYELVRSVRRYDKLQRRS